MKASNPYCTHRLWDAETHAARADMPLIDGKVAGFTERNRDAWRDWMRRTPKHLWWPAAIDAYAELDRLKAKEKHA